MVTTSRGIVYPDPSGVPSRAALQTIATSTDTAIGQVAALVGGMKIQQGSFVVTLTTSATPTTVNFPTAFGGAPLVHCTLPYGPLSSLALIRWGTPGTGDDGGGSTTQFEFVGQRTSGSGAVRVNWIAIGPSA